MMGGANTKHSVISGFASPGGSSFFDLSMPNYCYGYNKLWIFFLKKYCFVILIFGKTKGVNVDQMWGRRAPENEEDPFQKNLDVLSMGSISSRKHEMQI